MNQSIRTHQINQRNNVMKKERENKAISWTPPPKKKLRHQKDKKAGSDKEYWLIEYIAFTTILIEETSHSDNI